MSGFENAVETETKETTDNKAPETNGASAPNVQRLEDGSFAIDGRVYTTEAAAKKIENADTHISNLESENAEKDKINLKLIERIEALEAKRVADESAAQVHASAALEQSPTQEISKDDVVKAAVDTIKQEQLDAQRETNLAQSVKLAQSAYGEEFGTKVDEIAAEHGMDSNSVLDMAKDTPGVFKALFIPKGTELKTTPDPTASTIQGDAGQGQETKRPTRSWMRARNAKERNAMIKARFDEVRSKSQ